MSIDLNSFLIATLNQIAICMMTIEEINKAPEDQYHDEQWKSLIDFFWDRYNKRYFNQIKVLQEHTDYQIRNNCGFLMATIDCILIETLEQYYSGSDASIGSLHDPFLLFFTRSDFFNKIGWGVKDAGKFAGLVRSGLLHQSKTKKASIINKKSTTPLLDWIDANNKNKGFKLNRDKFHQAVLHEYEVLIELLKQDDQIVLRRNFKSKLKTLIE